MLHFLYSIEPRLPDYQVGNLSEKMKVKETHRLTSSLYLV